MKKIAITIGSAMLAIASAFAADQAAVTYLTGVPEFNTFTLGAAVVFGGMGFALLRKR